MSNPTDPLGGPPPFDQPQYGQPPYGQPQYGQPQYGQFRYGQPQYGQPFAGYGVPRVPTSTSGATAIVASVLALLGTFVGLVGIAVSVIALVGVGSHMTTGLLVWAVVDLLVVIASTGLLATGGVQLLRRRAIGRWLIVAGCALTILMGIADTLISAVFFSATYSVNTSSTFHAPLLVSLISLVFPVAAIILALVPSTAAYCAAPGLAQPGYPQPGYPQPGYPQSGRYH
ncbi:hypothetical protein [Gordonia aichiensis]|uniref:Uncharacterized protein n=1 Tax=Gordonia aichiensis NBRC 108223 TaxID=1220583 RepID=L7KJB3_9ACTN|nr:hypothetical protein [Gordonia aichiensis]GAC48037.1 hypothetical protein GOACH_04_04350 [Gordonia aichiensis NBRC 108223]